ncbi:RecB-family nuclease [Methanopyrus sp.]
MVVVVYHRPFSHFRVNHVALIAGNLGAKLLVYSEPKSRAALDGITQVLEHPEERRRVPVMVVDDLDDALEVVNGRVALLDPPADGGIKKLKPSDVLLTVPVELLEEVDINPDLTVGVDAPVGELAALAVVLYELGGT